MEIIIPMPQRTSINTYKELMGYLKQLELAVHYAQKSVESAEKEGVPLSEDCYVSWEHSSLEESLRLDGCKESDETLKNFIDNYFQELQNIELKININ